MLPSLLALLALLAAGAGCARTVRWSPPAQPGGSVAYGADPSAGEAGPPVRLPTWAGATAYGPAGAMALRGQVPVDSLRSHLVEEIRRVAREARRPQPASDVRLDAVAQDLARALRGTELPPFDTVDFLLGHYGLVEAAPNLLLVRGSVDGEAEITSQIGARVDEILKGSQIAQVGVGVHRRPKVGEMAVVVVLQEKNVDLASVPRRVREGGVMTLEGQLLGPYRTPKVIVTTPDGRTREQPISRAPDGVRFRSDVRCDSGPGRYQLEVTGFTVESTVVANFPVFCGVTPPAEAPAPPPPRLTAWTSGESEARIFELVNRDRRAARLPPVTLDRRLSDVARAHSQDMADNGFVGHVSPTTGDVLKRVQRAGIQPPLLMENIGQAYSPDEVQAGLMRSPGHRAAILDPRVTRVGVGVVIGRAVTGTSPLLVTQVFM